MKKLLIVLMVLVMVMSLGYSKTKLVHWMHHSPKRAEIIWEMADKFMEENPDIEIVIQTIPYGEYKTKLLAAIAAGSGPDVAQIPAYAVQEFLDYGIISEISEEVMPMNYVYKNYVPATIQNLVITNKLYGLPTDIQTIVLFYNPVLFEKAGIDPSRAPEDWNELMEYAKRATIWEDGKMVQAGLGVGGYHPVLESFMRQAGAKFWKNNNEIKYEDEQLEGVKFFTDAVLEDQVYTPKFGSRWTGFRQIKEAMVFGHGAMVGSFKVGGDPDLVFKTALMPANPKTGSRTTTLTSWSLVVLNDCQEKKDAAKWLAYISSEESQRTWLEETGELPSLKSVVNDPKYKNDELLGPILESLNYAVPTFSKGWADPASKYREIAYNEVINKGLDNKVAIEKTIKEINNYLEETFY